MSADRDSVLDELLAETRASRAEAAASRAELAEMRALLGRERAPAIRVPAAVASAGPTIAEVFKAYEEARKHEDCWKFLRVKLEPLVRILGTTPAANLTPKVWKAYRAARLKETARKDQPPSATTLNLELARAKTMLTWATLDEQEMLAVNPLRDARREKQKPKRKSWLSEDSLQKLLAVNWTISDAAIPMFRAWLLVMADTGLRFNEARRVRRDRVREVEDDETIVDIPHTKNRKAHVVGLTARSLAALDALPTPATVLYYFTNPETGSLYAVSTMWRWFRNACEACGIDERVAEGELRFRPHDARRGFATNAHSRGADLLDIQDGLNHSSPAITADYVQRNERTAVKLVRIMEKGLLAEKRRGPRKSHVSEGGTRIASESSRGGNA